ncbi:MAG TPA: leucyl aminopeptidase [Pirellulales bacterium]|jgi:leucyl aminopeptidase|nr:leucyl aminopeptidase [Pirellulales bacterium]
MNIKLCNSPLAQTAADAVVLGIFANEKSSDPKATRAVAEADKATNGLLSKLMEREEIAGKKFELTPLLAPPGIAAGQLLMIGLGDREKFNAGIAFRAAAAAAKQLAGKKRNTVAFFLGDAKVDQTEAAVAGAVVGCQGQDLYRAEKKRQPFDEILWSGSDEKTIANGAALGESMNLTRRLVNEPPDNIYPETFAARAAEVAQADGLECEIWDQSRLEKEKCGSLLAVGRGSSRPSRLVILRHAGAKPQAPKLALVGKGVTFDSGGLSLKPTDSMLTMKCDMAGAATVLGAMQAIARMKLPINVVGLMGLVENMTGPAAFKLGDVLTARSGRTIEVHNTDAEGRLVLADVLNVALDEKPSKMIDLATLTGACMVALGTETVGAMTNNQLWCDAVLEAARRAGEPAWQLPMTPEIYDEQIKSDVADIKNVGDGRWGGAITAAKFLEQFVGDVPWTHLDIAGPAFLEKPKPWSDGGATACMLRTLVEVARSWK